MRSPLVHSVQTAEARSPHGPDFWLSTYCIVAAVSLVLASARVAFCESRADEESLDPHTHALFRFVSPLARGLRFERDLPHAHLKNPRSKE